MCASSLRAVLAALLIVPFASGCVGLPTEVAAVRTGVATNIIHESTPVMVDAMGDVVAKRRLERIVASPEMKALQKELIAGMVESSLETLGDQKRLERIGGIAAGYANRMVQGLDVKGAVFGKETEGRMQGLVGSLVHASLAPVMKEVSEAEISPVLAKAMTDQLGPAVQKVLQDNVGPGVGRAFDTDEVHRALGGMARAMGREMVLGANEGLVIIQKQNKEKTEDRSLLGSVSLLADKGANVATIVVWSVGGLALLLAAAVVWLLLQRRRYRSDSASRAETTRLLGEAIRAAEDKPWSDELLAALEARFRDDEEAVLHLQAERARRRHRKDSRSSLRTTALASAKH